MALALASKWARNLSKLPKNSSIAAARSPVGLSPPSGDRFGQNTEWLMWPPRLKARVFSRPPTLPNESLVAGLGQLLEGGVERP